MRSLRSHRCHSIVLQRIRSTGPHNHGSLTSLWSSGSAVTDSDQAGVEVRVAVYDIAYLSPPILAAAERQASAIFREAGIEILWVPGSRTGPEVHESDFTGQTPGQGPCTGRPGTTLRLRIVPKAPRGLNKTTLGFALPCAKFGTDVTIFLDRIENMAPNTASLVPRVLGHAMAHELGHVLLRSSEHSAKGLMKDRWSQSDFLILLSGLLSFTAADAHRIRQEAVRASRALDVWFPQAGSLPSPRSSSKEHEQHHGSHAATLAPN